MMNLKCMLLSERIWSERATYCMVPFIWHSGRDNTIAIVKRISGFLGFQGGVGGMCVWRMLNRCSTGEFYRVFLVYLSYWKKKYRRLRGLYIKSLLSHSSGGWLLSRALRVLYEGKAATCKPGRELLIKNWTLPKTWSWTRTGTSIQNCKKINFWRLSHPACGILLRQSSRLRQEW